MDEAGTIVDGEVWRRIATIMFAIDGDSLRVQPGALNDHPEDGYLSVAIAEEVNRDEFIARLPGCAVLILDVRLLTQMGLIVRRTEWQGEPGHAGVYGDKPKSVKREIIRHARSLTHPTLRCVPW